MRYNYSTSSLGPLDTWDRKDEGRVTDTGMEGCISNRKEGAKVRDENIQVHGSRKDEGESSRVTDKEWSLGYNQQ